MAHVFLNKIAGMVLAGFLFSGILSTDTVIPAEKQPAKVDRLRLAGGDFGYPSPFAYVRGPGMIQATYLFDTLLWPDSTGKPIPWLASKREHSADGKEWRFTLRDEIKWHDGRPLTADDVVFSFNYLISGAGKTATGILGPIQVKEVIADGANVVVFRLDRPSATFEESVASRVMIIPKHVWAEVTDPRKLRGVSAVMGSGPYKLVSYDEAAGSYLYVANDAYFLGPPVVRRLEFVPAPDELLALRRGVVDAAEILEEGVPKEQLSAFEGQAKFGKLQGSGDWNLALHFNLTKGFPYNDKRFRQAVAYAIDRKDLVRRLLFGRGEPGSPGGLVPGHAFLAKGLPSYEKDTAKAKALLDEVGLKDVNGDGLRDSPDGKPFRQELQTSARFSLKSAELIKEYLRGVGIDLVVKSQDRAAADTAAAEGNYTMALVGYGGGTADPDFLRLRFASQVKARSFSRAQGYKNTEFDELAEQQLVTLDENKRREIIAQMQKILAEDLPIISLYVPARVSFFNKSVFDGWYYTPGCSPCRGTRNKHMLVTGKKIGF